MALKEDLGASQQGADDLDAIFIVEIDENGLGKVEFDSSTAIGPVMVNF